MSAIEKELRDIWTAKGVPIERQNELLSAVIAQAQPGAMIGPFQIPSQSEN